MSHTFRIYNNLRLKKSQRFNLDDISDIHPLLNTHINQQVGIPLTRRSWICMGKCPMCRDPKREPRKIRRQRKELLRLNLKEENSSEITIYPIPFIYLFRGNKYDRKINSQIL